jgi:Hemerythrin HHE cation binding domain
MTVLDKLIAAVTPLPSEEARARARAEARAIARAGDWLSAILDHHEQIEAAFVAAKAAGPDGGPDALKTLGALLNGHAMAEEAVVYPAMAAATGLLGADAAYAEQIGVKMQMAALEKLEPGGAAFNEKLAHVEGAVIHHVFEEESQWLPDLARKASMADQDRVTARYKEEFERYMSGGKAEAQPATQPEPQLALPEPEPRSFSQRDDAPPASA